MKQKDYTYPLAIIAAGISGIYLLQAMQFAIAHDPSISEKMKLFISSYSINIVLGISVLIFFAVFVDSRNQQK